MLDSIRLRRLDFNASEGGGRWASLPDVRVALAVSSLALPPSFLRNRFSTLRRFDAEECPQTTIVSCESRDLVAPVMVRVVWRRDAPSEYPDRSDLPRRFTNKRQLMTPEEQISKMKKAITQAIKVMGDRFGSTEQDVARAIQELKASMQGSSEPSRSVETVPRPGGQSPQETQANI